MFGSSEISWVSSLAYSDAGACMSDLRFSGRSLVVSEIVRITYFTGWFAAFLFLQEGMREVAVGHICFVCLCPVTLKCAVFQALYSFSSR